MSKKNILVTGGLGYIGSHTCLQLLDCGYSVTVLDNLVNSKLSVIERIEKISQQKLSFINGDIRDDSKLRYIFGEYEIDAVIHFAGLKSVQEAEEQPLKYYDNNVLGSIQLLKIMQEFDVGNIIFSSSATVYKEEGSGEYKEDMNLFPSNVYGRTKLVIEEILRDYTSSNSKFKIAILRYFNPIGAHKSGLIGEDPKGTPNNLMPYIAKVATGQLPCLHIFGNDYPTPDGTGLRDYIHVEDLAEGHILSMNYLFEKKSSLTLNLGTGMPLSVLDLIRTFEKTSEKKVAYKFSSRRRGDVAKCWADSKLAEQTIGWKAKFDIKRMCKDVWRWQKYSELNIKDN